MRTYTQREHAFIYDEEIPHGWRSGNMVFIKDSDVPGGIRHDIFIYNPTVAYEDRRENGEDARWIQGRLSCRRRVVTEGEWEPMDAEQYCTETGLFSNLLS